MHHLAYMAAAYTIVWAAILIYFISLSRRERAIWEELHALRESLSRGETSPRPHGD